MGSFTDNINALTSFKPYVAQQPVEAMVQVGMQKQAQYDQGIQKIQSQIDQVAGMDVVRDVDKQYLQSKLDTLGGNLRKVAAGDFSNYQLQNSVGGMVSNIAKDKNVQNAVSSTARYRKGIADMDAAIKEGKSSPSNEWDFQNQASKWLNGDSSASFTGGYNPYTNYKKNALEVIKSLTKDESIRDDAFTVDKKGNLVVSDSTLRKKLSGIDASKIQTALMATLSPADFKQMEIDGRYSYANASPEQLSRAISISSNEKIGFYEQQKKVLSDAKSATTSNVEKTKLDEQIAALDKTIAGISRENQGMLDKILNGDTEGIKAQLHTANFLDNFSRAFSFTETSQTYVGKTPQEMNMWRADKEQDWKKFIIGLENENRRFQLTYSQKERELLAKEKETAGYGILGTGVDQSRVPKVTFEKVIEETLSGEKSLAASDADFMKGKDKQWFDVQKKAWEERPSGVDPKTKYYFETTEPTRRKILANQVMISDIAKKAQDQFGTIEQYIPKDAENVEYFDEDSGEYITYTPEDFVKFNENRSKYIKLDNSTTDPDGRKMPKASFDLEKAKRELPEKEYRILEIQANSKNNPRKKLLADIALDYQKKVNTPYRAKVKEISDFTAKEVQDRVMGMQGASYSIPTANEAQKSSIGTNLTKFADLAESLKGELPGNPNFDVKLARALSIDPTANYTMEVIEGTEYSEPMYKMSVTGKEGNLQFNITPEQKKLMFGETFEASQEVREFRPLQTQIMKMGGKSTSFVEGDSNHNTAFLNKIDFPSVQNYGVKGDVEQISPGVYSVRLNLFDPISGQWYDNIPFPRNGVLREDQVMPLIKQLNDEAIYELLTDTKPSGNAMNEVKAASKKPL